MTTAISSEDEQALDELRASLLRRRCPKLAPDQGEEAFDQHMLLAIALHRVSRLHKASGDSDTRGWIRYVTDFFPQGRNSEADALALWQGWRCTLLKDEQPVVPITHGQSHVHWFRDRAGRPHLNLESLYADYEHSVGGFIEHLRTNADRRKIALSRWRERAWTVQPVVIRLAMLEQVGSASASNPTVMAPPP